MTKEDFFSYMNTSVVNVCKPVGKTPLEVIKAYREAHHIDENVPLGYAGRLDPMANGVMLILIGDENKKRKDYERLEKKYTFEVLFGIETDTYDIMGVIQKIKKWSFASLKERLSKIVQTHIGTWEQAYPPYSSVRVNGKPLFYWARENKLDLITIPQKKITIYSLLCKKIHEVFLKDYQEYIVNSISKTNGQFRQKEIIKKWQDTFAKYSSELFVYGQFEVRCSSGTYVRSLAHDMGAITLSITRTDVGEFNIASSERLSTIE